MAREEIDVSKNWLLPIEDVMHSGVMQRRLQKALGLREAQSAPGYLVRALKEQGVHYMLQFLALDRESFSEKSSKSNMEDVLDCAEIAVQRIFKDENITESVWIGKYKKDAGVAIPKGKTPGAYRLMSEYVTGQVYQKLAVVATSDMLDSEEDAEQTLEIKHEERLQEMRERWVGPQKPKLSLKTENKKAKAAFGRSRRGEHSVKTKPRIQKENLEIVSPKTSNVFNGVGSSVHSFKNTTFESGVSIEKFVKQNFKSAADRKVIVNFFDVRNLSVVEQVFALDRDVLIRKLPVAVRVKFAAALRQYGSQNYTGFSVGEFATVEARKALQMEFSEALDEFIFPDDKEKNIDRISSFIVKKAIERQQNLDM